MGFTLVKIVEGDENISAQAVMDAVTKSLKKNFAKVKIKTDVNGNSVVKCRVKTKFLNPIVSLYAELKLVKKDNKVKIMVDGNTVKNGWFWFTIMFSFFFWPMFLIDWWMWTSQRKKSIEVFEQTFQRLDFEFSSF